MKVIKAQEVPQNEGPMVESPTIDKEKVAELQEKFDAMQKEMETKSYDVYMTKEETEFFFNEFYPNIDWKGYESYAVSESYEKMKSAVNGEEINGQVRPEIVEAAFHFIKNFIGKGIENAKMFKRIADQLALSIQAINQDRQDLRDLSLEIVSTEQGIPVEQLVAQLNAQAQANK